MRMLTIRKVLLGMMVEMPMGAASGFIIAPLNIGVSEEDNP